MHSLEEGMFLKNDAMQNQCACLSEKVAGRFAMTSRRPFNLGGRYPTGFGIANKFQNYPDCFRRSWDIEWNRSAHRAVQIF